MSVRDGPLCRLHYVIWLEKQLGRWVIYSQNYKQAKQTPVPIPLPLFEQMEQRP
jgi:hypothetical protein